MNAFLKIIDMPRRFYSLSVDIEISIKQTERKLNKLISKAKKDSDLAELLISVKEQGEKTLAMLADTKAFLEGVVNDANVIDNARKVNLIENYKMLIEGIENQNKLIYDIRRASKTT